MQNARNRIYDLKNALAGIAAGALLRGIGFQPFDLGREYRNAILDVADGQQRQVLSQFVSYFLSRFVIVVTGHASLLSFTRL